MDLVVLLNLEELAPLGVVLNFWIEDLGPFDAPIFEVLDPVEETLFGLDDHKQEETVIASRFGGSEMTCECRELVDKLSNKVEGGMSHDCVDWDFFRPSPDHFGDGGHCFRDFRHDCAVLALTKIT